MRYVVPVVMMAFLLVLGGCSSQPAGPTSMAPVIPEETMPGAGGRGAAKAKAAEFDIASEPHSAGKKAMVAAGCFRCHAVNGARGPVGAEPPAEANERPAGKAMVKGGGGRGRGPDLGTAGQEPTHTVDWLEQFIRNPKGTKPNARMPAYEGKIRAEDLHAIAEYLASLK